MTDQNGAAISKVTVTAIKTDQGLKREVETNDEGYFSIAQLQPGRYTVTAQHEGFAPREIKDLVLHVEDQVSITIQLSVGSVSESVRVTDSDPAIQQSPSVSTVVDRQFVENLPLNGRSFQSLITLTPGVVLTKATDLESGQFSVNGQRANANYFTVDGVSANIAVSQASMPGQAASGSLPGLTAFGGTNNLVSVDALQEFKIQTSTYAPEFGRTPGAQVQISTRSGTNDFHGTLSEYFRNEALDANDWFNNFRGLPKPATRQNDFGGVLGGPIIKNQTFFFFSYEGLRLRLPQSASVDVPSLEARQAAPAAIKPLLNAYPLPNGPNLLDFDGQPSGFAKFNASFSVPSTLNATSIRVDHTVNTKLAVFGRYNYAPSEAVVRHPETINTLEHFSITTQTLTGGATLSIRPNVINELRVNYSRNAGETFFELDDLGGATVPEDSSLFPQGASRQRDLVTLFFFGSSAIASQLGTAVNDLQRQFNIVDNLSAATGTHQMKFGVDYRRLFPVVRPQDYFALYGFFGIGNPGAAVQVPGSALSGLAFLAQVKASTGARFPIFNNLSLYGQDTWRISQRLTLTYGLRWEVNPPPSEGKGNDALTVTGLDDPATATVAPRGTRLWKTTYNNFAPRIGVAHQLFRRAGLETLLRGGFGIFYDLGSGSISNAFGDSYPFIVSKQIFFTPFPLSAVDAAAPAVSPIPDSSLTVAIPDLKLPRIYQWNVALDQSLGNNQSVSASYVAAVGRRLLRQETLKGVGIGGNLNPDAFGPEAQVIVLKNTATSDYHALQVQFRRRLSEGLQALASYTWSHSIDISSNDSFNLNTPVGNLDPETDRGPSDFDVRHAFNAAVTYNIPKPELGMIGNAIVHDWAADAIFVARSATPVNVTYVRVLPGIGSVNLRPDLVTGIPLYLDDEAAPGGRRFNNTPVILADNPNPQIGPFLIPVEARQGTLGRNALRGFSVWQMDLALRREFDLTERMNLQLRAEFFNIFNHPNFADPSRLLQSPSQFGRSQSMLGRSLGTGGTAAGFNPLYQLGGPRSVQLAIRLGF